MFRNWQIDKKKFFNNFKKKSEHPSNIDSSGKTQMIFDVDCFDLARCKDKVTMIVGRKKSGKANLCTSILKKINDPNALETQICHFSIDWTTTKQTLIGTDLELHGLSAKVDYVILTTMPDKRTWTFISNYLFPHNQSDLDALITKLNPRCNHIVVCDFVNKKLCCL